MHRRSTACLISTCAVVGAVSVAGAQAETTPPGPGLGGRTPLVTAVELSKSADGVLIVEVAASEGYTIPVQVQRRIGTTWRTVRTTKLAFHAPGDLTKRVAPRGALRHGQYRARVNETTSRTGELVTTVVTLG